MIFPAVVCNIFNVVKYYLRRGEKRMQGRIIKRKERVSAGK